MADYTDGQGWSKLDATSARHLAQVISTFRGASRDSRTQMLLYCFSQLHGSQPYFRVGVRTIAKACEVTPRIAQRFLEFCEHEEIFKTIGKSKKGKTPKRTFFWLDPEDDRCNQERLHPVTATKKKRLHQCNQNTGSLVTHQRQTCQIKETDKSVSESLASSDSASAPSEARAEKSTGPKSFNPKIRLAQLMTEGLPPLAAWEDVEREIWQRSIKAERKQDKEAESAAKAELEVFYEVCPRPYAGDA